MSGEAIGAFINIGDSWEDIRDQPLYVQRPSTLGPFYRSSRVYVCHEGNWIEAASFPPSRPDVTNLSPTTSSQETNVSTGRNIQVSSPVNGGPYISITLQRWRYSNASGAGRTLDSERTIDVSSLPTEVVGGVRRHLIEERGLTPLRYYGWVARFDSPVGSSIDSLESRIRMGNVEQVTTSTPVHGWGPLSPWSLPGQLGMSISGENTGGNAAGHPLSYAIDSSPTSFWAGKTTYGVIGIADENGRVQMMGQVQGPPQRLTATLNSSNPRLKLTNVFLEYSAYVGLPKVNPYGVYFDGFSLLGLSKNHIEVGGSRAFFRSGSNHWYTGQKTGYAQAYWGSSNSYSSLKAPFPNFPLDVGDKLSIDYHMSPIFGITEAAGYYARPTAATLKIRAHKWEIVSYNTSTTTVVTPVSAW